MPPSVVRFHPEAREEAYAALDYYLERSLGAAATSFDAGLNHAVAEVLEAPLRWQRHLYGTRRYILGRYPYSVVYRIGATSIDVYAVAHAKRRPGYWQRRRF